MRYILIGLLLICNTCFAELCVVLDGNEVKGTLETSPLTKIDWTEYTLIPVNEEYRGLQFYEIKYENGNLRTATKEEKDAYKQQKEAEQLALKKQKALETLGLDETDISNIKKLKD